MINSFKNTYSKIFNYVERVHSTDFVRSIVGFSGNRRDCSPSQRIFHHSWFGSSEILSLGGRRIDMTRVDHIQFQRGSIYTSNRLKPFLVEMVVCP